MENPTIFANAFNQFLYHGDQKIDSARLTELDTTEILIPYGSGSAGVPEQKYSDFSSICGLLGCSLFSRLPTISIIRSTCTFRWRVMLQKLFSLTYHHQSVPLSRVYSCSLYVTVRSSQGINSSRTIIVTLSGIVTLVRLLHSANAPLSVLRLFRV